MIIETIGSMLFGATAAILFTALFCLGCYLVMDYLERK